MSDRRATRSKSSLRRWLVIIGAGLTGLCCISTFLVVLLALEEEEPVSPTAAISDSVKGAAIAETEADAAPIAQLPFLDDLTEPSSGVREETWANLLTYYSEDGFVMEIRDPDLFQMSPYGAEFPADISITADIGFTGDSQDTGLGLSFRVQDVENFYFFVVDGAANYAVFKMENGEFEPLSDWHYSPMFAEEPFSIEQVRVDVQGDFIQVYANGLLLTTLHDDTFSGGTIGLIGQTIETPDAGAFTNLEVVGYDERVVPGSADCQLLTEEALAGDLGDDIRVVPLGPLGADGNVTITLEPGDVSVLFSAQTVDASDQVVIYSITGPGGESLYEINSETGDLTSEMFLEPLSDDGEVTMYLPSAPQFGLVPGDYELGMYTVLGQPVCDSVAVIRSGDVDGPQAIDLSVWVVSENPTLQSPEQRGLFELFVPRSVDRLLNEYDMRLAQVNFFEATEEHQAEFARTDEDSLAQMCQAMAEVVGTTRALNMVLVDEFLNVPPEEGEGPEPWLGFAPIPGSVFAPGSLNSCFVVAWEEHFGNYDQLGATVVHEGSHFLGLRHTTEAEGQKFDLFADTPECPLEQFDFDGSGEVDEVECSGAGSNNFLFWIISDYAGTQWMSADQAWTIRRHPLFYSVSTDE